MTRKLTKNSIRYLLDYKETIEGLINPFNKDVYYDLLEVLYWIHRLEKEGTFTESDMNTIKNWDKEENSRKKGRIINELYIILDITNY